MVSKIKWIDLELLLTTFAEGKLAIGGPQQNLPFFALVHALGAISKPSFSHHQPKLDKLIRVGSAMSGLGGALAACLRKALIESNLERLGQVLAVSGRCVGLIRAEIKQDDEFLGAIAPSLRALADIVAGRTAEFASVVYHSAGGLLIELCDAVGSERAVLSLIPPAETSCKHENLSLGLDRIRFAKALATAASGGSEAETGKRATTALLAAFERSTKMVAARIRCPAKGTSDIETGWSDMIESAIFLKDHLDPLQLVTRLIFPAVHALASVGYDMNDKIPGLSISLILASGLADDALTRWDVRAAGAIGDDLQLAKDSTVAASVLLQAFPRAWTNISFACQNAALQLVDFACRLFRCRIESLAANQPWIEAAEPAICSALDILCEQSVTAECFDDQRKEVAEALGVESRHTLVARLAVLWSARKPSDWLRSQSFATSLLPRIAPCCLSPNTAIRKLGFVMVADLLSLPTSDRRAIGVPVLRMLLESFDMAMSASDRSDTDERDICADLRSNGSLAGVLQAPFGHLSSFVNLSAALRRATAGPEMQLLLLDMVSFWEQTGSPLAVKYSRQLAATLVEKGHIVEAANVLRLQLHRLPWTRIGLDSSREELYQEIVTLYESGRDWHRAVEVGFLGSVYDTIVSLTLCLET